MSFFYVFKKEKGKGLFQKVLKKIMIKIEKWRDDDRGEEWEFTK